jgi:hypothetical protein
MDSRLDKLKQSLDSAVDGMSSRRRIPLVDHPILGPLTGPQVEKASCGAWAASPQTAPPPSRKHHEGYGLNAGKRWCSTLGDLFYAKGVGNSSHYTLS